ncbi:antibiotic biosynthesis monooxygenase [Pseudomonas syringae group genomosp. 3]|uniref:antibiotic biosynthesis monooxygenase n=1 Tax=Pseudomonas syringae group genomosp. 3 TaxID=251701 RepID=UPI0005CB7E92|nr:antibiotic biosynthesis monooxygenase [Pseudomonas syringae group genomosp. 3]
MTESPSEAGFSQSLEILVSPSSVSALVQALRNRVEQLTSHHPGFVSASLRVSEHQSAVLLELYWLSRMASENALAHPKEGELDLFQLGRDFQAQPMIFRTFIMYAEVRAQC